MAFEMIMPSARENKRGIYVLLVAEQIVIASTYISYFHLAAPKEYKKESGQSRVPRMCPQ